MLARMVSGRRQSLQAPRHQRQRDLYRGASLIRNRPPPQGPPEEPRHGPTVGSYGAAVSYKQGTPVGIGAYVAAVGVFAVRLLRVHDLHSW